MRPSLALVLGAAALAAGSVASAQTATHDAKLHVFYRYGLDATRVRVDRIARVRHIDGRPYVRDVDPGDAGTGYLLLTLTVENPGSSVQNVPLFQTNVTMEGGHTIDPAVYGPFIGTATTPAPASATLLPGRPVTLRFAVADIPSGADVVAIVLNPNDATTQYRFRPAGADITPLPDVPRADRRSPG